MKFRENNNTMETHFKYSLRQISKTLCSVFDICLYSVVVFTEIHLIPETIDARLERGWFCSYKMTINIPICHVTMVYNVFEVVSNSLDAIVHMKYYQHFRVCINTQDTKSFKYFLFNFDVSHSIIHRTITNNYYNIYHLQLLVSNPHHCLTLLSRCLDMIENEK